MSEPVLIKRYAGQRLYDTQSAIYVSLEDLERLILAGTRFVVREAETGRDVTADVLARLQ